MDYFTDFDWSGTFAPQLTLLEVLVRGTLMYLTMIIVLRIVPKRAAGDSSITSMMFVVLIGGIGVVGVTAKTQSLLDLFVFIATIVFWVFVVDYLAFRLPRFRRLIQEPPTCLVKDGQMLRKNLRWEMISTDDLMTHLRQQNVEDLGQVQSAHLEADGSISVVTKKNGDGAAVRPTTPREMLSQP
jgi:uncharacterized membrane protein YcaP (DUF421 family)